MKPFIKRLFQTSVIIGLGISLLAFSARYASEGITIWISFFSLIFLPVTGVNLLLLAIACLIKPKKWIALPLIALLLQAENLSAVWQFPSNRQSESQGVPLTVVTYNASHFYWDRQYTLHEATRYLESLQPDILCMQEAPGTDYYNPDSIRHTFRYLPYQVNSFRTDHLPLTIYSRYPIRIVKTAYYLHSMNLTLVADIRIDNQDIRVISNHLQTTSVNQYRGIITAPDKPLKYRLKAVKDLLSALKKNFELRARQARFVRKEIEQSPYPILVCGDFNDTPASFAYHHIKGDLTDGFRECGKGYHYTFRQLKRLWRIDYIFHSPEFEGTTYYSPDLPYSDHNMVIWKGSLERPRF